MSDSRRNSKRWGNTTSKEGESSRVFVGNLPHSTVAGELEDKFKPYGDLDGVDINNNGFAFVQFRSIEEAKMAVSSENGSFMGGRKIEVRMFDKSGPNKKNRPNDQGGSRFRDRSPLHHRSRGASGPTPEPFAPGFHPQQQMHPQPFQGHPQQVFNPMSGIMNNNLGGGMMPASSGPLSVPSANNEPSSQQPNDVEIIVINREQWSYGEAVEKRLKEQAGIPRVDMLFLHSPQHISMTLNDLFDRGTLYAVVVAPENESHSTVTVHVLQNQTEYRNISLDKAIGVIASDFQSSSGRGSGPLNHLLDSRNGVSGQQFPGSASLTNSSAGQLNASVQSAKKLPDEIAYLLRTTLAEQGVQFLSLQQIDSIIEFFSRERERLTRPGFSQSYGAEYSSSGGNSMPTNSQAVDRQSGSQVRGVTASGGDLKSSVSAVPSGVPSNLLDNPQLKQALNALATLGAIAPVGQQNSLNTASSYDGGSNGNIDRFGPLVGAGGGVTRRGDQGMPSIPTNLSRLPPGGATGGQSRSMFGGPNSARF